MLKVTCKAFVPHFGSKLFSGSCHSFKRLMSSTKPLPNSLRQTEELLKARVTEGRGFLSFMVHSLGEKISLLGESTPHDDIVNFLKAFKLDIADLLPRDQKKLLEKSWSSVREVVGRTQINSPVLFHNALDAFIYQKADLQVPEFISDVERHLKVPDTRLLEKLLVYHCYSQDAEFAVDFQRSKSVFGQKLALNETIAASLVYCFSSRGEYSEADGVLQAAVKENLPTDGQIKHAFLVGVARDGDADRLARQLHHHQPGDQVLLDAAVALSEKAPQHLDVVVSRMPRDRLQLSQACLRPIKELIENGQFEWAETVFHKTEELAQNKTLKEKMIHCTPSVFVLKEIIQKVKDPDISTKKIYALKEVDSKIIERAVVLLLNSCFEDPGSYTTRLAVATKLLTENTDKMDAVLNLTSQSVGEKLKAAKTDGDAIQILQITAKCGLRFTQKKIWRTILDKLIMCHPASTDSDSLTKRLKHLWGLLVLTNDKGGPAYSDEQIWTQIHKYLITNGSAEFVRASVNIMKETGEIHGFDRWQKHLAENLLVSKDVDSYTDLLQIIYKKRNSATSGIEETQNYLQASHSLCQAVFIANRRKIDINELFENIFDHLWAKRLPLPLSVKDELVVLLQSEMLSAIASNLTSIVTQEPFQVPSNSTKKISNSSKKIKRSPMPKEQQFSRGSKIAI